MANKRKTWNEKLHVALEPVVKKTDKDFAGIPAGSRMLIATPLIVAAYICEIPEGTSTTLQQMRKDLAASYGAEYTCPVTAGIFLRIVAEAAYEQMTTGALPSAIAPFWRMIDNRAPIAKKLSFGRDFVNEQRRKEGLPE